MIAKASWRSLESLALLAVGLLLLSGQVFAQSKGTAATSTEPVVVSFVLNGTLVAEAQLLHREPGKDSNRIWLPEKEALRWRMDLVTRERRVIENVPHAAFCDQRDNCFYDEATALITVTLDNMDVLALRFTPTLASMEKPETVKSVGGHVNYDLSAWGGHGAGVAALLDGRLYSPYGHGAIRLGGAINAGQSAYLPTRAVWQIDRPEQALSLQVGSIRTPDTSLGAGLPLTGLRVGSNTRLQPMISNVLRPRIEGLAERSLRADVFVDGLFRQTAQVPYGPYSVELQPQFPGRGEMHLVATDISGLQTRSTIQYYNAPQILTPGVTEWSADLGVLANEGFGTTLQQPALISAMMRRGLDSGFTTQAQILKSRNAARLTLAADSAHPLRGLSSLNLVWQRLGAQQRGRLWVGVGHEYLAQDTSITVRAEQSLDGCPTVNVVDALTDRLWRPCRLFAAGMGFGLGNGWSVAAATEARQDDSSRFTRLASVSARTQVGARSQLALSLSRIAINDKASTSLQVVWSQPLGKEYEAQVGTQLRTGERPSLQWSAQSVPPSDAQATVQRFQTYGRVGPNDEVGARWSQRGVQADWRVDGRVDQRGFAGTVGVSGAVGIAEGRAFTSRPIDDAFIIVDVGLPDLPVLLNNREVARTNAAGWAVVTEGRGYETNTVGVDTSALPIEYSMPKDQQSIVPTSAAGVVARFEVSDGGLAIPVRDSTGREIPAGALVRISTQSLPTAVTSRSEVFLERSDRAAEVKIEWRGQSCQFSYRPQNEPTGGYRCI